MLVFLIIVNIVTCPVNIILNTLDILAVNIKLRLKTKSNVALSCLATTDGIMGLIGQPLFIAWIISSLHGQDLSAYCTLQSLSRNTLRVLIAESLFHLVLMKHSHKALPRENHHGYKLSYTPLVSSRVDRSVIFNHNLYHHGHV